MKIRFFPFDFILVFSIAILCFFLIKNLFGAAGGKVFVQADNQNFEYSLENEGIFTAQGELGVSTFEISGGKVRILDSPCPNKTCVAAGWSNQVVCLPNKIFIRTEKKRFKNGGEDLDGVSN